MHVTTILLVVGLLWLGLGIGYLKASLEHFIFITHRI